MNEIKKVTWDEVCRAMTERAKVKRYVDNDESPVRAVVVFDPVKSGWRDNEGGYDLESRSYEISSVDKYWHGECHGSSLYGYCLNKNDMDSMGVRLDWYIGDWVVDYCYFI